MAEPAPIAATLMRGATPESHHRAHLAVCDADGRLLAQSGTPSTLTFTRSSIKAYQLLPLISSGAADHYGFEDRELAVMCASHAGEPIHTQLVQNILERIGLGVDALQCGADPPLDPKVAAALATPVTALHNNCSGKHANLLAQTLHMGADPSHYLNPQHPVQTRILQLIARAADTPPERIATGTDGCSAPNFALSIQTGARLFATIADPKGLSTKEADALQRIRDAMIRHPQLVGGTDRFDSRLIKAGRGRLVAKIGGEAVFGVADQATGLGLYVKIEDGASRALPPTIVTALETLGWLDEADRPLLERDRVVPVQNVRGTLVGRIEPRLSLDVSKVPRSEANHRTEPSTRAQPRLP